MVWAGDWSVAAALNQSRQPIEKRFLTYLPLGGLWNSICYRYPVERSVQSLVANLSKREHFFSPNSTCWHGVSWESIQTWIVGIARRLYSFGVGADSIVGLCVSTQIEGLWIEQAVWHLGGAVIWFDDAVPEAELLDEMLRSEITLLVLEKTSIYAHFEDALDELETLMMVFSLAADQELVPLMPAAPDWNWFEQLQTRSDLDAPVLYFYDGAECRFLRQSASAALVEHWRSSYVYRKRVMVSGRLSSVAVRLAIVSSVCSGSTLYWSSTEPPLHLLQMARPQRWFVSQLDAVEALVSGWKPRVFPKRAVQRCGNRLSELICLQDSCSPLLRQVLSRAGVSITDAL